MTITLQLWHLVPVVLAAIIVAPVACFPREKRPETSVFLLVLTLTSGASVITGLLAQRAGGCP